MMYFDNETREPEIPHEQISKEERLRCQAFAYSLSTSNTKHLLKDTSVKICYFSKNEKYESIIWFPHDVHMISLKHMDEQDYVRMAEFTRYLRKRNETELYAGQIIHISYRYKGNTHEEFVCLDKDLQIIHLDYHLQWSRKKRQQNTTNLNRICENLFSHNQTQLPANTPIEIQFRGQNKRLEIKYICVENPVEFLRLPSVIQQNEEEILDKKLTARDSARLAAILHYMINLKITHLSQGTPVKIQYLFANKTCKEFVCVNQGIVRYLSRDGVSDRFESQIEFAVKSPSGTYSHVKNGQLYMKFDDRNQLQMRPSKKAVKHMRHGLETTVEKVIEEATIFGKNYHGKAHATFEVLPPKNAEADAFIVMQKVKGEPIDKIDFTSFSWLQKVYAALVVLESILRLHGKGIFHRDIKYSNLFFDRETMQAHPLDFNSSYNTHGTQPLRVAAGTPYFMSEEGFADNIAVDQLAGLDAFAASPCVAGIFGPLGCFNDLLQNRARAYEEFLAANSSINNTDLQSDSDETESYTDLELNSELKTSNRESVPSFNSELESDPESRFQIFVTTDFNFPTLVEDTSTVGAATVESIYRKQGNVDFAERLTLEAAVQQIQKVRNILLEAFDPDLVAMDKAIADAIKILDSYETHSKESKQLPLYIDNLATLRGQLGVSVITAKAARERAFAVFDHDHGLGWFLKRRLDKVFGSDPKLHLPHVLRSDSQPMMRYRQNLSGHHRRSENSNLKDSRDSESARSSKSLRNLRDYSTESESSETENEAQLLIEEARNTLGGFRP